MAAEYDKMMGDLDSRFSGLTGPDERKAAMREEVWQPTKTALQVHTQIKIQALPRTELGQHSHTAATAALVFGACD